MNMAVLGLTQTQREARDRRNAFYKRIADQAEKLAPPKLPQDRPQPAKTKLAAVMPVSEETGAPMPCGLPAWYFVIPAAEFDPVESKGPTEPRVEFIKHVVAAYFRLTIPELVSERRSRNIVAPRQIGFYLCKTLTRKSLPEIGRRFGNKDHTTVLYAVRKITRKIREDSDLANDVATLIQAIAPRYAG